jgi:hypothetical protein
MASRDATARTLCCVVHADVFIASTFAYVLYYLIVLWPKQVQ